MFEPHVAPLTDFTVGPEVAGPGAVAHVSVPALLAEASVGTGAAAASLLQLPGAETAHARCALDLGQAPHVPALAIDEEVADASHIAVAEQGRPHLRRQHHVVPRLRQPPQVHVSVQIQEVTALV